MVLLVVTTDVPNINEPRFATTHSYFIGCHDNDKVVEASNDDLLAPADWVSPHEVATVQARA